MHACRRCAASKASIIREVHDMKRISWLAAGALALAVGCASTDTTGPSGTAAAPHPAVSGPVATANGTIQNYTTGPSGQQNGFTLATGQRVHFPESMASKVSDQFPPNTQVKVEGYMIKDAEGRPVLEANTISAPDRNAKLDLTAAGAASPEPALGGSGPAGSQPVTPSGAQPVSPSGSQPVTPSGSQPVTPPAGTQPVTPR
jgi:hypothetical protein